MDVSDKKEEVLDSNFINACVGNRIKLRRNALKMSQDKLGQAIGVTFQQIQKYEKGINRIVASKLYQLSQVLDVNIDYFFHDLDFQYNHIQEQVKLHELQEDKEKIEYEATLLTSESLELIRNFNKIKNKELKRTVLKLVKLLLNTHQNDEKNYPNTFIVNDSIKQNLNNSSNKKEN